MGMVSETFLICDKRRTMKNEIEKILAEYSDGNETLQEATTKVLRLISVSGSLRIAVQKLLDAVGKHHPVMAMGTQLDLYMAYHEVKEALSNDR